MAKNTPDLSDHQYSGALPGGTKPFELARFDPAAKPFSSGDKARDKAAVDALALELDTLQNLFYADRRFKLLVVLQGTDTSGKDGTIRGVFGQMSALGVHTVGWKAPTEPERAHDYLWRIHAQVPGAGEVTIFNRSHYEDVLVPHVNGWITPEQTKQRYAHINDFERLLTETGTVVCKFLLHISKDEQRARLQERLDDPTKTLEVRRRRPGSAQAVAGLPAGLQRRDRRHRHALGAVDHRAGRLEDAPQPDDRHRAEADAGRAEAALPADRPGTEEHQGGLTTTSGDRPMTDLSAEFKALAEYRPTHKVRFVTAASLFDGHDAAINIMRRILQGMGAEVVHLGHNRSVDEVVTAALQEDAQGIAISSYQGGHVEYFKYMVDLLKARGGAHIQVFGGGGGVIVPQRDRRAARLRRDPHLQPRRRPAHGPGRHDRRDGDALRPRPVGALADRAVGDPGADRSALARAGPADHRARERQGQRGAQGGAARRGREGEDARARHHRHRRRRQVDR